MPYRPVERRDWRRNSLYLAIFLVVLTVGGLALMPRHSDLSLLVWLGMVAFGLGLLVRWHTRSFAYRCAQCGQEFEIGLGTDFISPSGLDKKGAWKYLKCPRCGQRTRARVLERRPG
ncbi:MAG: hypothetical protein AB1445_04980 [Bacillota bacterium]